MQHRDKTILLKISEEIIIAMNMIADISLEEFKNNEILKRAVCMTVINDFPKLGDRIEQISNK